MSDREPVYRNKKYLDDDERFQSSKKEVNFGAPERQSTIQATKVELSNEEANLIADNVVRDLNIPKDRIFADAINIIPLQGSVENMKNQIKEYQKNHQLNPDGKIGKHTYLELSMQAYFDDNRLIEMYNKGMSQSEQENILHFFREGPKISTESFRIGSFLENNFRNDPNYTDFFAKYDGIKKSYANSKEGKAVINKTLNDNDDYYSTLKELATGKARAGEVIKKLMKDPVLLYTAGTLFLFGVFGSNSSYTNGFFKRLGWIVGGTIFGPALWDKLGGDKILADIDEGVDYVKDGSKKLVKEVSESTESTNPVRQEAHDKAKQFVTGSITWVGDKLHGLGDYAYEKTGEAVGIINTKLSDCQGKNEAYKNSKDKKEKELYINDFELIASTLTKDDKFATTELNNLSLNGLNYQKIQNYLLDDTKKALFPDNLGKKLREQRQKDIVNFVKLLLKDRPNDAIFVGDIFINEKSFLDNTKEKLADISGIFKDDQELDNTVNTLLLSISDDKKRDKLKWQLSTILWDSKTGEKSNYLDSLIKSGEYTNDEKVTLKKLADIFFFKNIYDRFDEIATDLPNSGQEAITRLESEYKKYLGIINKHNPASDYIYKNMFTKRLFDRYIDKKTEIVIENDLTGPEYKLLRDRKELLRLSEEIGDLPEANLNAYGEYVTEERMLSYFKARDIYNKYDIDVQETGDESNKVRNYIVNEGRRISKQSEDIEKNIISMMNKEVGKINSLGDEINRNEFNFVIANFKEGYSSEILNIIDIVYPNNNITHTNDLNSIISYLHQVVTQSKSIFYIMGKNMRIIKGGDFSFDTKGLESAINKLITELKNTQKVAKEKEEAEKKEDMKRRKESLVAADKEIMNIYPNFYLSYEKFCTKMKIKDSEKVFPKPDELGDLNLDGLGISIDNMNRILKNIPKEQLKEEEIQELVKVLQTLKNLVESKIQS
ncbi:hypothetical protein HG430_004315 [Candidatus Gracilibacteria bacterium]|nr:hypothetical protein [Candidatus Gracilibacteria bacterium]